jgi:hypothetical protein
MQGFVNLTTNEMENAWRYDYLQRDRELKPTTGKFLASHLYSQDPTACLVNCLLAKSSRCPAVRDSLEVS